MRNLDEVMSLDILTEPMHIYVYIHIYKDKSERSYKSEDRFYLYMVPQGRDTLLVLDKIKILRLFINVFKKYSTIYEFKK